MLRLGPDGRPTAWSPAAQALLAPSGDGLSGLVVDDDGVLTPDGVRVGTELHALPDGTGWLALLGAASGLTATLSATARQATAEAVSAGEARLRALLRHATDVVVVVDRRGTITYVSPAVTGRLGYDEEQLRGTRALDLNHPDDVPAIQAAFDRVHRCAGTVVSFACRVRHADGSWRWTEQSCTNLLDDPDVGGVVVNLRDTTDDRRAEQDLRRLAVHDSLTGLANRTLLLDRVEQALQRSRHAREQAGLVLLDVVGMRAHNERLGHQGGDALLVVVAERLRAAVGPTGSVARVGQDEFGALVEDVTSAEDLRVRAAALLAAAQEPLTIGGVAVAVRLRAGTALTPAASAGALLASAEQGVRDGVREGWSRGAGAGGPTVHQGPAQAHRAAGELSRALDSGELRVHYQPVVRLLDGQVQGVEALVRWQHPVRGLLSPAEFVPLAEATGLVVEVGELVLRTACQALARWTAAGRRLTVGVNLSPRQLAVPGFGELLREVLAETGVRPEQLVLEVTESVLIDDAGALETLRDLHVLGVRLALDDFGTGYSSLTYLKRFPVDALKVDRSFVSGLGRDRDDEAIVASIVSLARSIGRTVVAEGVETTGQRLLLRELGVEHAQGFLWSPALPLDELERWLDGYDPDDVLTGPAVALPVDAARSRILALQADGASLRTIAAALNGEGLTAPGGERWDPRSVARVVAALVPPA